MRTAPNDVKVNVPASTAAATPLKHLGKCKVVKGFLPVTIFSLFFLSFPLINEYVSVDYDDTLTQIAIIGSSAIAGLLVIFANDCVAWFNMALLFHTGIEVVVVDTLATYARAASTGDTEMALAWLAATIIVVHLVPFYVLDHAGVLMCMAYAGIIVNTSALVFVAPTQLLLTGFSATVLLGMVLLVACIDCVRTSAVSQLRQAMNEGTWLLCVKYEM